MYPSGLIFIDGILYNDFRKSNAVDYSKKVIEWAKSRNIAKFDTAEMKEVRINH